MAKGEYQFLIEHIKEMLKQFAEEIKLELKYAQWLASLEVIEKIAKEWGIE